MYLDNILAKLEAVLSSRMREVLLHCTIIVYYWISPYSQAHLPVNFYFECNFYKLCQNCQIAVFMMVNIIGTVLPFCVVIFFKYYCFHGRALKIHWKEVQSVTMLNIKFKQKLKTTFISMFDSLNVAVNLFLSKLWPQLLQLLTLLRRNSFIFMTASYLTSNISCKMLSPLIIECWEERPLSASVWLAWQLERKRSV